MSDESDNVELSPEDEQLIDFMASLRAGKATGDLKEIYTNYIHQIDALSGNKKSQIGNIIAACNNGEDYCQGTYSQAWMDALAQNGLPVQFLQSSWRKDGNNDPRGEVSTNAALRSFMNNPDQSIAGLGQSIKDFPPGTTLEQMILQGYNGGNDPCTIPVGSLVLAQRTDSNGNPRMHAMMFTGLKDGRPMFSYANTERVDLVSNYWLKQQAESRRAPDNDIYIVNTPQAISMLAREEERRRFIEMGGRDAYIASYLNAQSSDGNNVDQLLAGRLETYLAVQDPIVLQPRTLSTGDEITYISPREAEPVPTSMEGSFWENLYGVLHYRRFHPRETEQVVETQEPPVANSPEQIVTSKLSDAYQQLESQQPPSPDPRPGAAQMLQQVGNGLVDNEQKGLTASTSTHTNDTSTKSKTSTQTQSYAPVKDGGR